MQYRTYASYNLCKVYIMQGITYARQNYLKKCWGWGETDTNDCSNEMIQKHTDCRSDEEVNIFVMSFPSKAK